MSKPRPPKWLSMPAVLWAMDDAPGVPWNLVSTLIVYARYADEDGRGSYPLAKTVAVQTRKSVSQAQRDAAALVRRGLLLPGDPGLVKDIRADRRPNVYDLAMPRPAYRTPRKPGHGPHDAHPVDRATTRIPPLHDPHTAPPRPARDADRKRTEYIHEQPRRTTRTGSRGEPAATDDDFDSSGRARPGPGYGLCPECREWQVVKATGGRVGRHDADVGGRWSRCPGSGRPPVEAVPCAKCGRTGVALTGIAGLCHACREAIKAAEATGAASVDPGRGRGRDPGRRRPDRRSRRRQPRRRRGPRRPRPVMGARALARPRPRIRRDRPGRVRLGDDRRLGTVRAEAAA